MSNEPFKCPDCKVWWRGETHKCEVPNVVYKTAQIKVDHTEHIDKGFVVKPLLNKFCSICGVTLNGKDWLAVSEGRCAKHSNQKKGKGYGWENYPPNGKS